MDFYDVEVDCMQYCYGGSAKFTVGPYGHGEWAKREDVKALIAERDRLAAECKELRWKAKEAELAMLEAQQTEDYWKSQTAAANATLDKLRDKIPQDTGCDWPWNHEAYEKAIWDVYTILYPETPNDER